MAKAGGHECYHCKAWVPSGVEHDCWTTTEDALTRELPDDIRDAWERLRETAVEFGEQRIYASHSSIMFARKVCHFFVRPRPKRLEVVFFLGRPLKSPLVKRIDQTSSVKWAHLVHIVHRDQVEPPLTEWLREAYEVTDTLRPQRNAPRKAPRTKAPVRKPAKEGSRKTAKKRRGRTM